MDDKKPTGKTSEPTGNSICIGPIHLKDSQGKGGIVIDFAKAFGYIPDRVAIRKVAGQNNRFVVCAPSPDWLKQQKDRLTKIVTPALILPKK